MFVLFLQVKPAKFCIRIDINDNIVKLYKACGLSNGE